MFVVSGDSDVNLFGGGFIWSITTIISQSFFLGGSLINGIYYGDSLLTLM